MITGSETARVSRACAMAVRLLAVLALCIPVRAETPGRGNDASGKLIARMPIKGAPEGAAAFRIRYSSIDEKGRMQEVTGIVVIPAGPTPGRDRDIVSWGRGTVGLAPVCAPSKTPEKMFESTPEIPDMLKRGWIVAASDFADPDSGRPHPYLVGLAEGHAMLDIVRAVMQMPEAHAGKRYALWGESEGAHAALWSAKLAPDYLPGFDLAAVAVAAPPTDLVKNFQMISSPIVRSLLTGYVTESWSKVYDIPLASFSNAFGRYIIRRLGKDCTRFDVASAFTNTLLLILSRQVPHNLGPRWAARLKENSVAPWHLRAPMLVAQGGKDDFVMPPLTHAFAQASCRLGDDVRFISKPDVGHLSIAVDTSAATVDWLAARFAGKPTDSDCMTLTKAGASLPPDPRHATE